MKPSDDRLAHRFELRVYYEDTDAGGVVYHASYLRFAERARTEMLRNLGWDHGRLLSELGLLFVVRRCDADFRRPARLDDRLVVETTLEAAGGASMDLAQIVRRADAAGAAQGSGLELARLALRLALLGRDGRPARLPPVLRSALHPLLNRPHLNRPHQSRSADLLDPEPVNAR